MKRLALFLPLLLWLGTANAPAQALPAGLPALAYTEISDGQTSPGIVFGVLHTQAGSIWLGPQTRIAPRTDKPSNGIGAGGSQITSEWMSGNIKRTVTTHSPPGRQGRKLALSRHNTLVLEALKYWPIDP